MDRRLQSDGKIFALVSFLGLHDLGAQRTVAPLLTSYWRLRMLRDDSWNLEAKQFLVSHSHTRFNQFSDSGFLESQQAQVRDAIGKRSDAADVASSPIPYSDSRRTYLRSSYLHRPSEHT